MRLCRLLALIAVALLLFSLAVPAVIAQEQCVPFGGTIYGWHFGDSWYGVGDFTVGKVVMPANVTDPNTGFDDKGDIWLGTEEATLDFGNSGKITLMTEFVTEHQTDAAANQGVFHVNETGYFARGTGRFKHAWGRFNLQGPFGPGVQLPNKIQPGSNDSLFWIGQYVGTICDVKEVHDRHD